MLYRIMNIGFTVSNKGTNVSCLDNSDDYAAGILNTMVLGAQSKVNQYPSGLTQQGFDERVKLDIHRELIAAVGGAKARMDCQNSDSYLFVAEMNGLPLRFKTFYGCESTSCDVKMADCH